MVHLYYLNLPKIPIELLNKVNAMIPLMDTDVRLIEFNKKEGISHKITYVPPELLQWLNDNIIPKIDPLGQHPEMVKKTMLHVNFYIEHAEGYGVHPIHFDYGRKWAFNYIIDAGGDPLPTTTWYEHDKTTVIESSQIPENQWCLLHVKPIFHGVTGQQKGRLRIMISLCYDPTDDVIFNPLIDFKNLICDTQN